jgi:L-ascorbate metabolism protein UlaG (beta-lactamase superfamily)
VSGSPKSLMQGILNAPVRTDELLVRFPGQNGFIFRTCDLSLGVGLHLLNSCANFDESICAAAGLSPDLLLVCTNGRWGNMGSAGAAELTGCVCPTAVTPMHYNMFVANCADPNAFV